MSLRLYNSLTQTKEPLEQHVLKKRLGMYACGPTVYDEPHLGHARSAFCFELIRNVLASGGYDVFFIRNVTDIDDKIIERSRREGGDLRDAARKVSQHYAALYQDQMTRLGLRRPDEEPKATEYIGQMKAVIQEILNRGFAYVAGSDVYFDITKAEGYGRLSGRDPGEMLEGTRGEVSPNKRNPLDFALWKGAKPEEPSWESPWGPGRPGWHIECTTMSTEIFKRHKVPFVVHGGGLDLIFPHHENEMAQAEGAGRTFASLWVHNGLITVNGQKMSKSLGNFVTLREIFEKASPEIIRFYFLQTHYRSPLDFSWDKLEETKEAYGRFLILFGRTRIHEGSEAKRQKIKEEVRTLLEQKKESGLQFNPEKYRNDFFKALEDDVNTPEAIAVLFSLLNHANGILDDAHLAKKDKIFEFYAVEYEIRRLGKILGLLFDETVEFLNPEEESLVKRRNEARKQRDFATADLIRRQLLEKGIILEDAGERTLWRRAK